MRRPLRDPDKPARLPSGGPAAKRPRPELTLPLALGIPIVLAVFASLWQVQIKLDRTAARAKAFTGTDEMMYFPSGRLLDQVSGEFKPLVADYAWLRAIQYYAFHMAGDRQFEWLGHIVRIAARLDPKFLEVYRFGAMAMTWDANQPGDAITLLREGMRRNQASWELPFDAAFIAYQKQKDFGLASRYFNVAAKLPDVWTIVPRWAAYASTKTGDLELTRQIWTQILQTHPNAKLRDIARRQLLDLLALELVQLQHAVDSFERDHGRPPTDLVQLAAAGYTAQVPTEPFGGRYELRQEVPGVRNATVISTTVELARALEARLQSAVDAFRAARRSFPATLEDLVDAGFLRALPPEPLGGEWEIRNGRVGTTSVLP